MKKSIIILLALFPYILLAQNKCSFFEHAVISIEKTQINTIQSDFGPAFVGNELFYSAYTDEEIEKLSDGKTKKIFYNLFSTATDEDGNLKEGKKAILDEISEGYHTGPVSYCEETGELFVTLSNFEDPEIRNKVYQKADIRLRIVVLKKSGTQWVYAYDFPHNNKLYSVGHPAASVTGDTLYFVSDMPDSGAGGTDIYMSKRENGTWGDPVNLGSSVNTSKNEMFPFLFKGNMLIFSSNGINEKEDLDIFYSCIDRGSFGTPVALNDFNSNTDDFGLVINDNTEVGYYTSQKDGGMGDDDIYKVMFEVGTYDLELIVQDKASKEPIAYARVAFDDGKNMTADSDGKIERSLDYDTDYVATSEVEDYMNESVTFTTKGKPYGTIKSVINIEKVVVEQIIVVENIYYDYDKWDILPESEVELDKVVKILNDNPGWKVELGSHTDCRGTDSYNELLSQKRSDSAVGYIVSKGIAKERIVAKGYGETQLVNECKDGVECSEEKHRLNRRTEFKILELGDN